MKHLTKT